MMKVFFGFHQRCKLISIYFFCSLTARYEDKFNFLKSPLSLFYATNLNDANLYIRNLVQNFKKAHERVTFKLPIEKENFGLQIDDEAFDEYVSKTQSVLDRSLPVCHNYRRDFAINHLKINLDNRRGNRQQRKMSADITFFHIFFKKIIIATNDQSYATFILNVLNVLSIWFGLSVLELFDCVKKHLLVYRLLINNLRDKLANDREPAM